MAAVVSAAVAAQIEKAIIARWTLGDVAKTFEVSLAVVRAIAAEVRRKEAAKRHPPTSETAA